MTRNVVLITILLQLSLISQEKLNDKDALKWYNSVQEKYQKLKTFTADIISETVITGNSVYKMSGKFYVSSPDKFRIHLKNQAGKTVMMALSNGQTIWQYSTRTKKVQSRPASDKDRKKFSFFPSFDMFDSKTLSAEKKEDKILLSVNFSKKKNLKSIFSKVTMLIGQGGLIQNMTMSNKDNSKRISISFKNSKMNGTIEKKIFEYRESE